MVELEAVEDDEDIAELRELIEQHRDYTGSTVAAKILDDWPKSLPQFVKVMPTDYKRVLTERKQHDEEIEQKLQRRRDGNVRRASALDSSGMVVEHGQAHRLQRVSQEERAVSRRSRAPARFPRDLHASRPRSTCAPKARAAWTAACRSARANDGCPIDNLIPEWNDLVYQGRWRDALDRLHKTNNFPSSPAAPAPRRAKARACSASPTRRSRSRTSRTRSSTAASPKAGSRRSRRATRTGKRVAIVGSGPAGLAAAAQLNKVGHKVTVYERADRIGGLLMYGIPNMKLDKGVVERRVDLLRAEGVEFVTNADVGKNVDRDRSCSTSTTRCCWRPARRSRATCRCPGRELDGIHFAMEFLTANTKSLLDSDLEDGQLHQRRRTSDVIVIGGGDTGTDCIGTSLRHGCKSLVNFELLDQPPASARRTTPGRSGRRSIAPTTPTRKSTRSSATIRATTRRYEGVRRRRRQGRLRAHQPRSSGSTTNGAPKMVEVEGSDRDCPADLVLLAMGFLGPEAYLAQTLGVELDRALELQRRARQVRDERARRLRRRRLPPRPIARRLGHQRRPRRRARRRPISHGLEHAAGAENLVGRNHLTTSAVCN